MCEGQYHGHLEYEIECARMIFTRERHYVIKERCQETNENSAETFLDGTVANDCNDSSYGEQYGSTVEYQGYYAVYFELAILHNLLVVALVVFNGMKLRIIR